jgi:type 1 glutamine amidotransferase
MPGETRSRAHVIAGGFPRGAPAGHDHDYARLQLLEILRSNEINASVANDFGDIENWLPISKLLVTYVAGPYPDEVQNRAIRRWLEDGGHWLGLHGTSGGRAVRTSETDRRRRMLKLAHHETLGGFFLNHPPVRRFRVDVHAGTDRLTEGLPQSFEVIDEPYMIEVQDRESTRVLLTAELGPDSSPPGFGFSYEEDTALGPDGRTRVLGYTRDVGKGRVTYIALGHCHDPASNSQPFVDRSVDPEGRTPATLRQTWETAPFRTLLQNAVVQGMGA